MTKGKAGKAKKLKEKGQRRSKRLNKSSYTSSFDTGSLENELRKLNLRTKDVAGDGNCLFRALSDQYHGKESNHKEIRQEICQYLREHEEEYKYFVEDDQTFEHHVDLMSQNATFGGNMELVAFAKLKKVDIKVYQPGMIYVIQGTEEEDQTEVEESNKHVLHIAYHSWEHYSSIDTLDGSSMESHVDEKMKDGIVDSGNCSDIEEKMDEHENPIGSKEKVIMQSCPGAKINRVRFLIRKFKGDVDKVIDCIYEAEKKAIENDSPNEHLTDNCSNTVPLTLDDEQNELQSNNNSTDCKMNNVMSINTENGNTNSNLSPCAKEMGINLPCNIKDIPEADRFIALPKTVDTIIQSEDAAANSEYSITKPIDTTAQSEDTITQSEDKVIQSEATITHPGNTPTPSADTKHVHKRKVSKKLSKADAKKLAKLKKKNNTSMKKKERTSERSKGKSAKSKDNNDSPKEESSMKELFI
ncbi:hypothetical protein BDB01DRAFT_786485 [Pilobolus umbonatus]|nr:hypothetical protein BDB01DRAFT_786485 [Pilobolus umbonatus]